MDDLVQDFGADWSAFHYRIESYLRPRAALAVQDVLESLHQACGSTTVRYQTYSESGWAEDLTSGPRHKSALQSKQSATKTIWHRNIRQEEIHQPTAME